MIKSIKIVLYSILFTLIINQTLARMTTRFSADKNMDVENLINEKYCVNCDLQGKDFSDQNLNHVDISHSNSKNSNFENTSMERIKAVRTNFENSNLNNIDGRNSDFEGGSLENSKARNANFSRSNFYEADLEGIDGQGANFRKSNLAKADFTNANLKDANFEGALIFETEFEGSDRTDATWTRGEKCLDKDCQKTSDGKNYEDITSLLDEIKKTNIDETTQLPKITSTIQPTLITEANVNQPPIITSTENVILSPSPALPPTQIVKPNITTIENKPVDTTSTETSNTPSQATNTKDVNKSVTPLAPQKPSGDVPTLKSETIAVPANDQPKTTSELNAPAKPHTDTDQQNVNAQPKESTEIISTTTPETSPKVATQPNTPTDKGPATNLTEKSEPKTFEISPSATPSSTPTTSETSK